MTSESSRCVLVRAAAGEGSSMTTTTALLSHAGPRARVGAPRTAGRAAASRPSSWLGSGTDSDDDSTSDGDGAGAVLLTGYIVPRGPMMGRSDEVRAFSRSIRFRTAVGVKYDPRYTMRPRAMKSTSITTHPGQSPSIDQRLRPARRLSLRPEGSPPRSSPMSWCQSRRP